VVSGHTKAGEVAKLDAPYEAPTNPEIHLQTTGQQSEQLAERLLAKLAELGITR
jgi:bifunctional enzyme CysN/CysC